MTYVISDIHGQYELFLKMLKKIKFSDDDFMYVLGDVIDRGPCGIPCLLDIMQRKNMQMILGNHEYMMLNALDAESRLKNGGFPADNCMWLWNRNDNFPTLSSYRELSKEKQCQIISFLKELPVNIEITVNNTDFLLTHAAPLPDKLKKSPEDLYRYANDEEFAVWSRSFAHDDIGKIVVYGHTPTINLQKYNPARVYRNKNYIDIDCGCAYIPTFPTAGGRLACVRLDDMKNFY